MEFKSYQESMIKGMEEIKIDANMSVADFEKMSHNVLSHIAYEALDMFRSEVKRMPGKYLYILKSLLMIGTLFLHS